MRTYLVQQNKRVDLRFRQEITNNTVICRGLSVYPSRTRVSVLVGVVHTTGNTPELSWRGKPMLIAMPEKLDLRNQ